MIERQLLGRKRIATVLAAEPVAQEDMVAGKCHLATLMKALQRDDGRDLESAPRGMYFHVIINDRNDPFLKHRDQRVLPRPDGQWPPAQWLHIRVQHQRLKVGNVCHRQRLGRDAACITKSKISDPPSGKANSFVSGAQHLEQYKSSSRQMMVR